MDENAKFCFGYAHENYQNSNRVFVSWKKFDDQFYQGYYQGEIDIKSGKFDGKGIYLNKRFGTLEIGIWKIGQ